MFTTVDKAIVAVLMGALSIAQLIWHIVPPTWLNEANILAAVAFITPVLVYLIPNVKKE